MYTTNTVWRNYMGTSESKDCICYAKCKIESYRNGKKEKKSWDSRPGDLGPVKL